MNCTADGIAQMLLTFAWIEKSTHEKSTHTNYMGFIGIYQSVKYGGSWGQLVP